MSTVKLPAKPKLVESPELRGRFALSTVNSLVLVGGYPNADGHRHSVQVRLDGQDKFKTIYMAPSDERGFPKDFDLALDLDVSNFDIEVGEGGRLSKGSDAQSGELFVNGDATYLICSEANATAPRAMRLDTKLLHTVDHTRGFIFPQWKIVCHREDGAKVLEILTN